uniref:Uncharacterized protein n=1 Tax=Arundo donax TaxID=35708 RepID=A0A0A9FHX9_ARUDO
MQVLMTSGRFLRADRGDGFGPASPHGGRRPRRVTDPQAPDRRPALAAAVQRAPAPAGAEPRRPRLQRQAHAPRLHCLVAWVLWGGATRGRTRRASRLPARLNLSCGSCKPIGRGRQKRQATAGKGRRCEWWKCGDVKWS